LASLPPPIPHLPPDLLHFLADVADGDARQALNSLELALKVCEEPHQASIDGDGGLDRQDRSKRDIELMEAVRRGLRKGYDRSGEERYDMISALHKCLRGSDGSAAMYWLARMITGGEDALYIARRLVVVASEDVGLADNHALPLVRCAFHRAWSRLTRNTGDGDVSGLSSDRLARMSDQPRRSCFPYIGPFRSLMISSTALCRVPSRSTEINPLIYSIQPRQYRLPQTHWSLVDLTAYFRLKRWQRPHRYQVYHCKSGTHLPSS